MHPVVSVPAPLLQSVMKRKRDNLVTAQGLEMLQFESSLHCTDVKQIDSALSPMQTSELQSVSGCARVTGVAERPTAG